MKLERNDHLDPRDKIKYGQEINSIFENLSKNEKIKESLERIYIHLIPHQKIPLLRHYN